MCMGKIQIMWRKYKYGIIVVSIIVIFLLLIIFFVYRKEDIIALSTIAIAIVTLVYASLTYLILDEQKSERTINFINNEIKSSVIDSIFEQYYKNKKNFEEKMTTDYGISLKYSIENKIKPGIKNTVYFDIVYSYYFKKYFPYTYSNIEKYEEKLKLYYENVEKIFEPIAKKFGIEKGEDTYYKAVHVAVYRDKKVTYEDIKKDFPSQCEEYENIKDELKKLNEDVLSSLKKEIKIYNLYPPVVTHRAR